MAIQIKLKQKNTGKIIILKKKQSSNLTNKYVANAKK